MASWKTFPQLRTEKKDKKLQHNKSMCNCENKSFFSFLLVICSIAFWLAPEIKNSIIMVPRHKCQTWPVELRLTITFLYSFISKPTSARQTPRYNDSYLPSPSVIDSLTLRSDKHHTRSALDTIGCKIYSEQFCSFDLSSYTCRSSSDNLLLNLYASERLNNLILCSKHSCNSWVAHR